MPPSAVPPTSIRAPISGPHAVHPVGLPDRCLDRHAIEEAEQTFAPWRVATEPQEGGTRLRCGRDRLEMFAAMLLSMGRRIVVYRPVELCDTFRQLGRLAMQTARRILPPRAFLSDFPGRFAAACARRTGPHCCAARSSG